MKFNYLLSIHSNLHLIVVHFNVNLKELIVLLVMTACLVECQSNKHYLPGYHAHQPESHDLNQERPEFIKGVPNLSIVTGKDAVMRCSVKNLGNNIISWHHLETNSDLTINKQVLSPNPRIKVTQDQNDWLLIINNASLEDRGFYICRINWLEPKSQLGYLNVVEPPKFDESSFTSGSETTVHENSNLTLTCRASGNPSPTIEWRREDGRSIYLSSPKGLYPETGVPSFIGEELRFSPVTRWNMGSYLCIASNGVPPSISRRVIIYVQFAPVIRIPSVSVTGTKGANLTLQCSSESSPIADHIWLDSNGTILGTNNSPSTFPIKPSTEGATTTKLKSKYSIQLIKTYAFKVTYQLTIIDLDYDDTGRYICYVNNSLGLAKSSIFLQVKNYQKSNGHSPSGSSDESSLESDSDKPSSNEINPNLAHPITQSPASDLTSSQSPYDNWIPSDVRLAASGDDNDRGDESLNQSTKDESSQLTLLPIKLLFIITLITLSLSQTINLID